MSTTVPEIFLSFLAFQATTVLTYIAANLSFIPIHCPERCVPTLDRCCDLVGTTFEVSHTDFSKAQHRVNLRFIMLYSIAVFFLGNKFNQISPYDYPETLLYTLISPVTAFIMAYMSNVKGLQTSCSRTSIRHWPIQSWIVYTLATLTALPITVYNFYLVYTDEGSAIFVCYITLIILMSLFELTLYKLYDPSRKIHIHHLFIGTMGATLIRANSPFTIPLAFLLYGVGIEGASDYGFPDIFED